MTKDSTSGSSISKKEEIVINIPDKASKQKSIDKIKIDINTAQGIIVDMVDTDFFEKKKSTFKQSTIGGQSSMLSSNEMET